MEFYGPMEPWIFSFLFLLKQLILWLWLRIDMDWYHPNNCSAIYLSDPHHSHRSTAVLMLRSAFSRNCDSAPRGFFLEFPYTQHPPSWSSQVLHSLELELSLDFCSVTYDAEPPQELHSITGRLFFLKTLQEQLHLHHHASCFTKPILASWIGGLH